MNKSAIAGVLLAASCITGWSLTAVNGAEDLTAYFTEAQAERGKAMFTARCEGCHGTSVQAVFPSYATAEKFYLYISGSMPADNPGSMENEQYADIVAYMLSTAGWPAGDAELTPNRSILAQIVPGAAAPAQ